MNLRHQHPRQDQASVLVVTLVFCGIILVLLASTLSMTSGRSVFAMRSIAWNSAIPMAEAGVEEALTQIQVSSTNLAANGWTHTNGLFLQTRTLAEGFYIVSIQPSNSPTIYSTGYVRAPLQSSYISRTVRVTTRAPGKFPYAMLARGQITIGGSVDSYNSSIAPYDSSNPGTNATVATTNGGSNIITIQNKKPAAVIRGYADTGPGGTISISGSSAIGDNTFDNNPANGGKAETGHTNNNCIVPIADVAAPYTSGQTPASGTVGGTNYDYALTSSTDYYYWGDMTAHSMIVASGVSANLYVTGNFTTSGSDFVYIAPGASLTLYVGGASANVNGTGIVNASGIPSNLAILGLPGCTSVTVSGKASFVGTIYAPEADLTFSSATASPYGACVGKTISTSANVQFHYDEAIGGGQNYSIASWAEL